MKKGTPMKSRKHSRETRFFPRQLLEAHSMEFRKELIRITEGVYVAVGFDESNAAMIEGDDGIIVIDTLLSIEAAESVFKEFRGITKKPVKAMQELYAFLGVSPEFAPKTEVVHNVGGVPRRRLLDGVLSNRRLRALMEPVTSARLRNALVRLRQRNLAKPPSLPIELRRRLVAVYRDDWRRLEDLVGCSVDIWREAENGQ